MCMSRRGKKKRNKKKWGRDETSRQVKGSEGEKETTVEWVRTGRAHSEKILFCLFFVTLAWKDTWCVVLISTGDAFSQATPVCPFIYICIYLYVCIYKLPRLSAPHAESSRLKNLAGAYNLPTPVFYLPLSCLTSTYTRFARLSLVLHFSLLAFFHNILRSVKRPGKHITHMKYVNG